MSYFNKLQRQWLVFLLLASLLIPIILTLLIVGVGMASGCPIAGKNGQMCLSHGINIGQNLKKLVDLTWNFSVLSLFQVPLWSIALVIFIQVLIYKSFRGWVGVFVAVFSIWYISFAPLIAGIVVVAYLSSQAQCSLNEGGIGACYVFGVDMGSTFHTAAVLPWLLMMLFPLCGAISLIYIIVAQRNLKNTQT